MVGGSFKNGQGQMLPIEIGHSRETVLDLKGVDVDGCKSQTIPFTRDLSYH